MEECPQSKGNCTELPNSTSEGEDAYLPLTGKHKRQQTKRSYTRKVWMMIWSCYIVPHLLKISLGEDILAEPTS